MSILSSRFQTLRKPTPQKHQNLHNNNNNKLILKLLVGHTSKESSCPQISLLSFEKEDHRVTPFPNYTGFGYPFASCQEMVLARDNDQKLALWEPSTNEFIKTLPQLMIESPPSSVVYYKNVGFHGFGLDPKTGDYKVLQHLEFEYENYTNEDYYGRHRTELYSLKTDSWKEIACPDRVYYFDVQHASHPVYINGFNYWPVLTRDNNFAILSFDFAEECFPSPPLIPGPYGANYKRFEDCIPGVEDPYRFLVAEYEGLLAVVVVKEDKKNIELWVWNNNQSSWSRRGGWEIPRSGGARLRPLGLYLDDQFFFQDSSGEFFLFDCSKQELKSLGLHGDHHYLMSTFPYYTK